jgi:hypothetical protein
MKYHLMQPVIIVADTLNFGLPVRSLGYVTDIDPRPFVGVPYYVRVPSEQKGYWIPECDLEPASQWIAKESDKVIQESLIDFALRTGNKAMFMAQLGADRP